MKNPFHNSEGQTGNAILTFIFDTTDDFYYNKLQQQDSKGIQESAVSQWIVAMGLDEASSKAVKRYPGIGIFE
jgi:hypothetical protein